MAHTRKDTLIPPSEWWKHLRPYNKRQHHKAERRAARKELERERDDEDRAQEIEKRDPD